jgi:hypothetical protein
MDSGSSTLVLALDSQSELFTGPSPGARLPREPRTLDDVGAMLGEPGTLRLLRMLASGPAFARLVVQIDDDINAAGREELLARLRHWCQCQMDANRQQAQLTRRAGLRALRWCLLILTAGLVASLLLQSEEMFGPPGVVRSVLSEAAIIAGWVAMWRPFELLIFDPMRPKLENRLLQKLLTLPWSVEAGRRRSATADHVAQTR